MPGEQGSSQESEQGSSQEKESGQAMTAPSVQGGRIPRLPDDYTRAAAAQRLDFLNEATGTRPRHLGRYGMDPADLAGNIENFVGAAQVPVGVAGPLLIDGEHARGEFYVPLATTEGTLVASYNRGMKLLDRAGGVRATVMDDVMQRAPAFGFDSAREARAFGAWVTTHFGAIKDAAEATTHTGHLRDVEQFTCSVGCYGPGQVGKLAEIVAATVLCGEISLGSAVVAEEWVDAHERFGRNRP